MMHKLPAVNWVILNQVYRIERERYTPVFWYFCFSLTTKKQDEKSAV